MIEKFQSSEFEKFILLKDQISGRAKTIIGSLETSKQSYQEAKGLLLLALASPTKQRYETIQKLFELKMPHTKDPYTFASEIRILQENFRTLNIDSELILQFCIWKTMNETLQNNFIQITNNNNPSISEINAHLFTAIER